MSWAVTLAQALGVHLVFGLVFGLVFLVAGLERVDPASRGSSWRFRLLILPGLALLWPLMALRWARGGATEDPA